MSPDYNGNHQGTSSSDLATATREGARNLREAAAQSAQQVAGAASVQARELSDGAREWIRRKADLAGETAAQLRERAGETASHLRESVYAAGDRGRAYVRDEPVKSVLVAAAIGAVIAGLATALMRGRQRW